MKWIAGWNLPGCLPEMEPMEFDNQEDASLWLEKQQMFVEESNGPEYDDPYVYWVEPNLS